MKPRLILPVPTLRNANGSVDFDASRDYAERAARTWVELFLLSGSTGLGNQSSSVERAHLLDIWLKSVPGERILAACWTDDDARLAQSRRVRRIAVMQSASDNKACNEALSSVPDGALVYSHPRYSRVTFSPEVAQEALRANLLPAGAKVSKISTHDVRRMREIVGTKFELWHGSSRDVAASIAAGASGVVAMPLAALPVPFPKPAIEDVQSTVDKIRSVIGGHARHVDRVAALCNLARQGHSGSEMR